MADPKPGNPNIESDEADRMEDEDAIGQAIENEEDGEEFEDIDDEGDEEHEEDIGA